MGEVHPGDYASNPGLAQAGACGQYHGAFENYSHTQGTPVFWIPTDAQAKKEAAPEVRGNARNAKKLRDHGKRSTADPGPAPIHAAAPKPEQPVAALAPVEEPRRRKKRVSRAQRSSRSPRKPRATPGRLPTWLSW